jgi:hypothetical protein
MPYPNEFYYTFAGSQASYTDTPTSQPDFDRILKFEAKCFIDSARRLERKPKKLILSDWTARSWDPLKLNLIQAQLRDLGTQGFELYLWQSDEVKPLTKEHLSDLKLLPTRQSMKPEDPKKIIEAALKKIKQVTCDNVLVLDDYWVNRLLSPEDSSIKHQLKISDLANIEEAEIIKILTFFSRSKREVEEIVLDELSKNTERALTFLNKNVPNYKIKTAVDTLKYKTFDLKGSNQFREFQSTLNYSQLKKLELSNSLLIKEDLGILQQAINLNALHLLYCSRKKDELTSMLPDRLPFLKILDTKSSRCTINLKKLLEITPALEMLSFKEGIVTGSDFLPGSPSNLKILNAEYSDITTETLHALLEKTAKLESLNLNHCTNIIHPPLNSEFARETLGLYSIDKAESRARDCGISMLAGSPLPCLKTIDVSESSISVETLKTLMERAVNLEELRLNYYKNEGHFSPNMSFTRLKKIDAVGSSLSRLNWIALLKKTPNIEELNLRDCKNAGDCLTSILPDTPLPRLKNLCFEGCNFKSLDLRKLLQTLPNIEAFDFHMCEEITGDLSKLQPLQKFPNLKEVDLRNTDIMSENLKILLEKASNLKALDLTCCTNLDSNFSEFLQETTFPHLESIYADSSNITAKNLGKILQKTTSLKKLHLSRCKNIVGVFSQLPLEKNFPMLKRVVLNEASLNADDIQALLKKAPNLKEIQLEGCDLSSTFANDLLLAPKFLHLKKIKLREIRCWDNSLKYLMEHSPHLEEIELSHCELPHHFFSNLNLSSLANLDEVTASKSISPKEIAFLLENTPKLEYLHLEHDDIESIFSLINPEIRLKCLKYLTFDRDIRDLDLPSLKKLVTIAPNLDERQEYRDYLKSKIALQKKKKSVPSADFKKQSEQTQDGRSMSSQDVHCEDATKTVGGTTHPSKRWVDANTRLGSNLKFNLKRIFYSTNGTENPKISMYRLESLPILTLNKMVCPVNEVFELSKDEENLQLISCHPNCVNEDVFALAKAQKVIYGKQSFSLDEQWQAVASTSPCDELLFYRTAPVNANIELQYSQRDNIYYIRSKAGSMTIDFDFGLKGPVSKSLVQPQVQKQIKALAPETRIQNFQNEALSLEIRIQNLVCDLLSYGNHDLDLIDPDESTGQDYLDALLEGRTGRCEHRAIVFKAQMSRYLPQVPTRIINNDCHSFVEVYLKGQWHSYDLGGYPAKLDITEQVQDETPEIKNESLVPPEEEKAALPATALLSSFNPYYQVMQTWSKKESKDSPLHPLAYCQELLKTNDSIKKTLIELGSLEAVNAMVLNLQGYCKSIHRKVFTIHSPSDVVCKADYMKREGNVGKITKGPGGPLYEFLTAPYSASNPPVLIVNYANFTASDIVALNDLLNREDPRADGISLPKNTIVMGAINTKAPDVYEGSDFYSRFDKRDCPSLPDLLAELPFMEECKNTEIINLFHAPDWKVQLLGHWSITETGFCFKEGILSAAIATGKPIEIQNGLWEDPEFLFFWQQANFLGEVRGCGELINTKGIGLLKNEGYDWTLLKTKYHIQQDKEQSNLVINPHQLSEFFGSYHYNSLTKKLILDKGLIEKAHDEGKKSLTVYITRGICEPDWARLLSSCVTFDVSLQVKLARGVTLPQEVSELKLPEEKTHPWDYNIAPTGIIASTDPDTTIAMLKQKDPSWLVIDASECQPSDLLLQTRPIYNKEQLELSFSQKKGALLSALKEKKQIILTGHISEELADALSPLLLHRKNQANAAGKLLIVAQKTENLRYMSDIRSHTVTLEEKGLFLDIITPTEEPLSLLTTREQFPNGSAGLLDLKYDNEELGDFNPQTSLQESLAFHARRNLLIREVLFDLRKPSPAVFITGLSGVGKSTFIEKEFMKGEAHKVFAEHEIEQWASLEDSQHPKILFIDEANLSSRLWSEMEGLYHNNPPTILINGKVHTLSPNHKVIFAGNPVSYGDERQLAPFFLRHPCAIEFKPLPLAVIFEHILKPVFANMNLAGLEANLCQPILEAYAFLCRQSIKEVLISPRELQMIALLTTSYCKKMKKVDPTLVARHYTYELVKPLVPTEKLASFQTQFGYEAPAIPALPLPLKIINANPIFRATQSRLPTLNRLHELLLVRESRQAIGQNEAQLFGGLGGVILEGESSVGKSVMVQALLRAHGFQEEHNLNKKSTLTKSFYRMNVAASLAEKEKLLIKAFYEGAVVLIDEINSSPMMERLLNDLLMGKLPEKYKKANQTMKPGFMIIGTQNPVSMAGRRPCSNALSRRLISMEVPSYSYQELLEIVVGDKHYPERAMNEFHLIIEAFTRKSAQAKEHHYHPAPTLREVFREVDKVKQQMPALKPIHDYSISNRLSYCKRFFARRYEMSKSMPTTHYQSKL